MIIGVPNALLNIRYKDAIQDFFTSIGVTTIVSPKSNKNILDIGVMNCVDEACLPVKLFHGHVEYLKDKCDFILIPRIMKLDKNEFICPKFCGLPEMVVYSTGIKNIIAPTIYAYDDKSLKKSLYEICKPLKIKKTTFENAVKEFKSNLYKLSGFDDFEKDLRILILGHSYNVLDDYVNMNLIKKLKKYNVETFIEDSIEKPYNYSQRLYKKPFWTFFKNSYNTALTMVERAKVDGIIYISSFGCGIDSFAIDIIKRELGSFPFLVIKIDEHTGEAGIDTRVEAFIDLLRRRKRNENNISALG